MKRYVAALSAIVLLLTAVCSCLLYQNSSLQKQTRDTQNQNSLLEEQVGTLSYQLDQKTIQINTLQTALEVAETPELSNWNNWLRTKLGVRDINSSPYPYPAVVKRLFIQGEVWNTGNDTAYGSKLNVKIYQNGILKYDVYIELGDVASGSHVYVEENIVYSGYLISDWDIFPVFSNPSLR